MTEATPLYPLDPLAERLRGAHAYGAHPIAWVDLPFWAQDRWRAAARVVANERDARHAAVDALRKPEDVACPPWPACERHGGFGSRGCTCGQEDANDAAAAFNDAIDAALAALVHLCGHVERVTGCGGCDPGAIEYVLHDSDRKFREFEATRGRESDHGPWDKSGERFEDGCRADALPHEETR